MSPAAEDSGIPTSISELFGELFQKLAGTVFTALCRVSAIEIRALFRIRHKRAVAGRDQFHCDEGGGEGLWAHRHPVREHDAPIRNDVLKLRVVSNFRAASKAEPRHI